MVILISFLATKVEILLIIYIDYFNPFPEWAGLVDQVLIYTGRNGLEMPLLLMEEDLMSALLLQFSIGKQFRFSSVD